MINLRPRRSPAARRVCASLVASVAFFGLPSTAHAAYTKIAHDGTALPAGAVLGTGPTDWACTRDDATGLVYEIKTFAEIDARYTLADASDARPRALNAARLCGYSDWRLPSLEELYKLVIEPANGCGNKIDAAFFPNSANAFFWTATKYVDRPERGAGIDFCERTWRYDSRPVGTPVNTRLVRGGRLFDRFPATATACQPVTFDFSVDAYPRIGDALAEVCGDPQLRVTVYDGTTALCSSAVDAAGVGSCEGTLQSPGQHALRIEYHALVDGCTNSGRSYYRNEYATLTVETEAACAAGTYVAAPATADACQVCSLCPPGTISTTPNTFECGLCDDGTFASQDQTRCIAHTTCAAGTRVSTEGDVNFDRTCEACGAGTFSAAPNQESCTPFTACPAGSSESTPGTATNDRVCERDLPEPEPGAGDAGSPVDAGAGGGSGGGADAGRNGEGAGADGEDAGNAAEEGGCSTSHSRAGLSGGLAWLVIATVASYARRRKGTPSRLRR